MVLSMVYSAVGYLAKPVEKYPSFKKGWYIYDYMKN